MMQLQAFQMPSVNTETGQGQELVSVALVVLFLIIGKTHYPVRFCRDGWMYYLRFYVLFKSISVILGRWAGDNERLCIMEDLRHGGEARTPGTLDQ